MEAIAMGPNIPSSNTPKSNRLLAALPEDNYRALLPVLEPVVLPPGKALYEYAVVKKEYDRLRQIGV